MNYINKTFVFIMFVLLLPATSLFAFESKTPYTDIQLVGMPAPVNPDDIKKQKPTTDPEPEEYETDIPPDIAQDNPPAPDGPVEYDPDNPYAEWER